MEVARGAMEVERLRRLCRLTEFLNKYQEHPKLRNEISVEEALAIQTPQSSNQSLGKSGDSTWKTVVTPSAPETEEYLVEHENRPFESSSEYSDSPTTHYRPDVVAKGLLSLYHDYHKSIPVIMSPNLLDATVSGSSEEADAGVQEQYAMSKSQVQLTLDEGNLWRSFLDPSAVDVADARKKLEFLWQKSESLSKSYERRNNAPTTRTYKESKLILKAMGVPCIEPDVPYEAEALAASLVHHGYADYVASEDTVCPSA